MALYKKSNLKITFLTGVSVIWIIFGLLLISLDLKSNCINYKRLFSYSLEDRRAVITGVDFYKFLKFCDKLILKGRDIKWIFPEGRFLGNDEYHFYKAYYYLFPRNYRDNADYIIVYNRKEYKAPLDFKIFAEYGPGKYILKRK